MTRRLGDERGQAAVLTVVPVLALSHALRIELLYLLAFLVGILTVVFVHVGLMHLLVNMAILLNIGLFTEQLFGNGGFTVLYLLSGLGGSLTSLAWRPLTVSAGASGAILGLYGGCWAAWCWTDR